MYHFIQSDGRYRFGTLVRCPFARRLIPAEQREAMNVSRVSRWAQYRSADGRWVSVVGCALIGAAGGLSPSVSAKH
ncbi:hypothetical protein K505DRAFT_116571 [Melanomma pulvis-pyrius CBS 109.77]|uniref:Uncharacterized protein n=1 Tax=Melanomma pulvis-pyrius CBS 109.77 TaxID=1314802 RepID=A0A6A6XPE9_9PLEO|nr:hypothetical protein K505DRAFT_116571 [Melanomma pulvis-pyrius CBS 109.77]